MKYLVLATLVLAAALPSTLALPAAGNDTQIQASLESVDLKKITDSLLFNTTIKDFTIARNAQDPSGLDWGSDGCTMAPDHPLGFDFEESCQRHDFGYRNYKRQDRFSDKAREKIDKNFRKDMEHECDAFNDDNNRVVESCLEMAGFYFGAVRVFGKRQDYVDAEEEAIAAPVPTLTL